MELIYIIILGLIIIAAIALLIFTIVHPLPCMIVKILMNVGRVLLLIPIFKGELLLSDGDGFLYFCIKMALITGLLTLYGGGASVYQDTVHETGNLLLNPTDVGFVLVKEKAGDSAIGNFISAVIISVIVAVVALFVYGLLLAYLSKNFGEKWPVIIIFGSLSIIGIVRSICTFIFYGDN